MSTREHKPGEEKNVLPVWMCHLNPTHVLLVLLVCYNRAKSHLCMCCGSVLFAFCTSKRRQFRCLSQPCASCGAHL